MTVTAEKTHFGLLCEIHFFVSYFIPIELKKNEQIFGSFQHLYQALALYH